MQHGWMKHGLMPWFKSPMKEGWLPGPLGAKLQLANLRATVITSQLPISHWHEAVGDPTLADAILDRVVHNAYKINLSGSSMRKEREKLTTVRPTP